MSSPYDSARGLMLGTLGVVIFAMTLPMTKLAVGSTVDPQLPPLFVTAGRAALAGVRASLGFWLCALAGCALVLAFAAHQGQGRLGLGDLLLLLAVACAAVGYVAGAQLAMRLPAEQVICWVLVLALPATLLASLATWPADIGAVHTSAWWGLAYVAVFSMWLGFFAWYRGLALGGVMRVSQVQLLQPFLALLFAVPVLDERLEAVTLLFAAAVVAMVLIGQRMPKTRAIADKPCQDGVGGERR